MRLKTLALSICTTLAMAALLSPEVLAEDVDITADHLSHCEVGAITSDDDAETSPLNETLQADSVDITADHLSRDAAGVITATGNVETKRLNETIEAGYIRYDPAKNQIHAEGNVILTSPQAVIKAPSATMNTITKDGELIDATIFFPDGARMQSTRMQRKGDYIFEAESVYFTPCPADSEAWGISAATATIDQNEGSLSATDARLEIGGVPVFYSPYWSQSLRRKSGFMLPTLASGKRRGTEYALPFYFAPAPNWDATFTPRWMSARGFMPELEFRHVSPAGREEIKIEGISDKVLGRGRQRAQADIAWRLPYAMNLNINADYVSDQDYLADLSRNLDESTKSYLVSNAVLSGYTENSDWALSGTYQEDLLAPSNAATLQIAPRLESHSTLPVLDQFAFLHLDQQTTRFERRQGVDGWRFNLHPYIEIPFELAGGGVSSTLTLGSQHTRYWLRDTINKRQPTRTSAEIGLETRAIFERISTDGLWRNSIEPTIRYDFVEVADQSAFPNFDSSFGQLTISSLLTNNLFSGHDRIERAHRISMLVTSRLQSKDNRLSASRELAAVSFGTVYDMLRESVDPAVQTAAAGPFSNLFGKATLSPLPNLSISAEGQYDPRDQYWPKAESAINWRSQDGHTLGVSYYFVDARLATPETQSLRVSGEFALTPRWKVSGSMFYDTLLKITQNASVALKYTHPCWNLLVEGYRTNRPTGTSTASDTGFRFLLGFKGLGRFGS